MLEKCPEWGSNPHWEDINSSASAISKLIGMGSHNCAVFSTTDLAWGLSKYVK
jgi:hypothetical protein